MNIATYRDFTSEELLADGNFCRWVLRPVPEDVRFWSDFLATYPDRRPVVDYGRALVLAIDEFGTVSVTQEELDSSYETVRRAKMIPRARPNLRYHHWLKYAAGILLLVVALGYAGQRFFSSKTGVSAVNYTTGEGEIINFELPDGSVVTLNQNGQLRAGDTWSIADGREVWLDGEAYFSVSNMETTGTKFIVHANGLDVEVYGTQFNVNSTDSLTQVALEEGNIGVSFGNIDRSSQVNMTVGEVLSLDTKSGAYDKIIRNTAPLTSWKDDLLVFDKEVTLAEVARKISQVYQVEITINKEEIKNIRVRATLPSDGLEECVEALQLLLESDGIDVTYGSNTIQIE